jgi:hypothetical protein
MRFVGWLDQICWMAHDRLRDNSYLVLQTHAATWDSKPFCQKKNVGHRFRKKSFSFYYKIQKLKSE